VTISEDHNNLKYFNFQLGWFETNCYLIWDPISRHALVIDPGAPSEDLETAIVDERLRVTAIINTHGHADHIGGNFRVKSLTSAPLFIHENDQAMLQDDNLNLSAQFGYPLVSPPADDLAHDGQQFILGRHQIEIYHTPGHTPGSICIMTDGYLLSGDTLFAASVGRTDLPGGNMERLIKSLQEKIIPLPSNTVIFPGHGPFTTLDREKKKNPFLVNLSTA
jgi:hydroxyacylglutathione hydrolase